MERGERQTFSGRHRISDILHSQVASKGDVDLKPELGFTLLFGQKENIIEQEEVSPLCSLFTSIVDSKLSLSIELMNLNELASFS